MLLWSYKVTFSPSLGTIFKIVNRNEDSSYLFFFFFAFLAFCIFFRVELVIF